MQGQHSTGICYQEARHKVAYHYGKTLGAELAEQKRREDDGRLVIRWGRGSGMRLLRWKPEDIGEGSASDLGGLALVPELQAVVDEVRFWHSSQEWYRKRRLPWKRGFMFHGEPGTGKTTLARELALELDLPVHVIDLASMSNEDLRNAWTDASKDAPCMVLMEDIDGVFQGRTNVTKQGGMMSSGGLSFDALLNCIDGVERASGVLLVMTTNRLQNIDNALFDRPGRIDRVVEFPALDAAGRLKLAEQILGQTAEAAAMAMEGEGLPPAKFIELCCRRALEEHYRSVGSPYR